MTIAPEIDAAQVLTRTLKAHGVKAIYATTFNGPTITQHAFALEAGVKVAKVEALSKDLALSLGLDDVRIVAPIPGTAYVGIEVPRTPRENVYYQDFLHDISGGPYIDDFSLPFPVGVTIGGEPLWADLAALPHLLIAGSTGSGKSVALNGLITSLIDHRTPDEVRLWLVDPKRVELGAFERAPHVERIATDVREAIEVLESVVDIMDHRYQQFEQENVRNITEHNAKWENVIPRAVLPYHVVVIDELADLMMQAKVEVEPLIVRIAQLARAAGIHLVLATQRPVVGVVTGLIAANVVSRWVFAVRSSTDSKVALEQVGAQALYGHGDSLWLPAGASKPIRVQGVYTDAETLESILDEAEDQRPDVESSASPGAASEDDDFDLGVEQEQSVVEFFIDGLEDPRAQEIARENLRDLAITEDTTGLGTYVPQHAADPEIDGYDGMGATIATQPILEVDAEPYPLDAPSNLEDPANYNLQAELAPLIVDIVERAIDQRNQAAARDYATEAKDVFRRWFVKPAAIAGAVIGVAFVSIGGLALGLTILAAMVGA